jgi:hypothetical protein
MSPSLLQIAQRIDTGLKREIGAGVDLRRLLAQPLYARDVLLVCDALQGTELAALSAQFRQAAAEPTGAGAAAAGWGTVSDFGPASKPPADAPRWFSPSRWFGADVPER